jgi:hypothetical protein
MNSEQERSEVELGFGESAESGRRWGSDSEKALREEGHVRPG